jgi:uncharacterized protein YunC (DUF1805 family)
MELDGKVVEDVVAVGKELQDVAEKVVTVRSVEDIAVLQKEVQDVVDKAEVVSRSCGIMARLRKLLQSLLPSPSTSVSKSA